MSLHNNIAILFVGVLMIISCQDVKHTPKPDNLIPEDKMVHILVDMAKMDAAMSLNRRKFKKRNINPQKLILNKYQIDSLQLVKSNAYYAEQFKTSKRIYKRVHAILEQDADSLRAIERRQHKKAEEPQKTAAE